MRTLFITGYTPRLDTGRGVRSYGVIAALSRLGPVEVAYRPFDGGEPSPRYAELPNVALTPLALGRGPRRAIFYLGSRARGDGDVARAVVPEVLDVARAAPADVRIVADGLAIASTLSPLARRRAVVYCAHNFESGFRHTLVDDRNAKRLARQLRRVERRVLGRSAETWMVSEADVASARQLCPGARLRLVPNVVDVARIDPVAAASTRRVVFVGDLTYTPNQTGLAFLRDEVWPRLRELVPDAEIVVAGRGGDADMGTPGVHVMGFVDNLPELYASAAVVAVPLRQGGGSPLKFVEALAYGLPVVATSKAAAGLAARPDEHYLNADDAAGFAAQLARVLLHGAGDLGRRGRQLALTEYSIESLVGCLEA